MKIALEVKRWSNPMVSGPLAMWRDSEPFVENKRGLLTHRPRSVSMYRTTKGSHIAVGFWCGMHVTDSERSRKGRSGRALTFVSVPDEHALVCHACEARAVMAGLPTSTSIAGHHVHIGKLKAVMTCCSEVPA